MKTSRQKSKGRPRSPVALHREMAYRLISGISRTDLPWERDRPLLFMFIASLLSIVELSTPDQWRYRLQYDPSRWVQYENSVVLLAVSFFIDQAGQHSSKFTITPMCTKLGIHDEPIYFCAFYRDLIGRLSPACAAVNEADRVSRDVLAF